MTFMAQGMSTPTRRLFIGGLNAGTSEQDIRERFKTFGSVSSVELHKVVKKEGFPEKTFAYIDIESSDSNIKRCISMLSNTKWRGGVLKIEQARESFLSRLQKEREELATQKAKPSDKECSPLHPQELTTHLPRAVPGTHVPGQKNWVVGKFGRVLPVVHMRPKHGNKMFKFDPSKTVHNLKRIKDDGGDQCVSELTWNLEEKTYNNQHTNQDIKNPSSSDENSDNEVIEMKLSKKKRKIRTKENTSDIDNPLKDLSSLTSKENTVLKKDIDSSIINFDDDKYSQTKRSCESTENEKLNSRRDRKRKKDLCSNVEEQQTVESLITNGEGEATKEGKKRKLHENISMKPKKKKKSETELEGSSVSEAEERVKPGVEEFRKEETKDDLKQKVNGKLSDGVLFHKENDISGRESLSSAHENKREENKTTKREQKKKQTGKALEDLSNKEKGNISKISNPPEAPTLNEEEKEKRKQKKRKEKGNEKIIEIPVDATDSRAVTAADKTAVYSQELANGDDIERTKQKVKKKRIEKSKEKDLDFYKSEERSFTEISDNNTWKERATTGRGSGDSTSSVDRMDNNNQQIPPEDTNKTKTHNALNGCMEEEDTVKKKSKTHSSDQRIDEIHKEKQPKKQGHTSKKLESNAKRLQALKERESHSNTKQLLVASALQNLDKKDRQRNPQHITFDDEEGQESDKEKQANHRETGKISGSEAAHWLGLDSDDANDDTMLGEQTFNAKPQFEGKAGQKLFELQKTYRGDTRFQLDKRFIESEDESDEKPVEGRGDKRPDDADVNVDDDDAVKKQLSQEKSMAMSVLRRILGENFGSKRTEKFKNTNLLRYDPTKDDHAQFEQKPQKDESPEPAVKESQRPQAEAMPSVPEVTQEKYYDVKTDALTAMFGEKKEEQVSTPFTFLSNQDDQDDEPTADVEWGEAKVLKSKPWNPVMLPYDSSGDEDDGNINEEDKQDTQKPTASEQTFFFHFGDPELESIVYDHEAPFMRTETLAELNQYWVNVRSELTQDYKKKHKDTRRRNSKIATKRLRK